MKKVLLSAITFCFLSTAALFAQEVEQDRPEADVTHSMKTEVEIHALPEAVLNALSGEEYQEWTPTASYIVIDENETEQYAVELQNADETKSVLFDADGNEIESQEAEEFEGTEGIESDEIESDKIEDTESEGTEMIESDETETEVTDEPTEELN